MSDAVKQVNKFQSVAYNFKNQHILVIGDVMLDRYIVGDVTRISPEAPVPVVNVTNEYNALGGAGNVAANVKSLGGFADLIGGVGEDDDADNLLEMCNELEIRHALLVDPEDPSRPTTRKTRIVSNGRQLLRIDVEDRTLWDYPAYRLKVEINSFIHERIGDIDAIIISDYNKGFVTRTTLNVARSYGVPVIVDPKCYAYEIYKGVTALTPNQNELQTFLDNHLNEFTNPHDICEKYGIQGIFETLGKYGVNIWKVRPVNRTRGQFEEYIPGYFVPAIDITGAGDTFTAVIALCLAQNTTFKLAANLATMAGSLSVQASGCHAVPLEALLDLISVRDEFSRHNRITS